MCSIIALVITFSAIRLAIVWLKNLFQIKIILNLIVGISVHVERNMDAITSILKYKKSFCIIVKFLKHFSATVLNLKS